MVTDPRFAKVHTDPRFQIFPSKQRKVVIDDRFKGGAAVLAFSLPTVKLMYCSMSHCVWM